MPLDALDVALVSCAIKMARCRTSPRHVDNLIDLAGYAVCGAGIVEAERVPKKGTSNVFQNVETGVEVDEDAILFWPTLGRQGLPMFFYVAGPFSNGDVADAATRQKNINMACGYACKLAAKGHYVHIPHSATAPLNGTSGTDYEYFMRLDHIIIRGLDNACMVGNMDFVGFRVPGDSAGADRETKWLHDLGRHVYTSLTSVPSVSGP